jgi:SNF2 family DNA or RNA helicase
VHRLVTLGTFEEKIDEMLKSKTELANLAVQAGEKWITELSNQQLKDIFAFGGKS